MKKKSFNSIMIGWLDAWVSALPRNMKVVIETKKVQISGLLYSLQMEVIQWTTIFVFSDISL